MTNPIDLVLYHPAYVRRDDGIFRLVSGCGFIGEEISPHCFKPLVPDSFATNWYKAVFSNSRIHKAMIVPQFWAEGRIQDRVNGRQVTVRRHGWSDISQEAAQTHAEMRVKEAFERVLAGEDKVLRRERKVAYGGAEGVPIREEIVERHDDVVITRNSYGARCLNTPNVLFADIDFDSVFKIPFRVSLFVFALFVVPILGWCLFFAADMTYDAACPPATTGAEFSAIFMVGALLVLLSLVATPIVISIVRRLIIGFAGGIERFALKRIERFVRAHPDWHLSIYRTPAGMRVLALHRTFDPTEPDVDKCFKALGADPLFMTMCRNQHCFRARVSPKPWRIGIEKPIKGKKALWPLNPEKLPARKLWIEHYEQVSTGYSACRFLKSIGSGRVDPIASNVQKMHDELCRSGHQLPLA